MSTKLELIRHEGAFSGSVRDVVNDNFAAVAIPFGTPSPAVAAAGKQGRMMIDAGHIYVCVADGIWKRAALSDWTAEEIPDVPPVTLSPTGQTTPAAAGSYSFSLTVTGPGESGTWIVDPESSAPWLHLVSPPAHTPQSDPGGQILYTVDANDTGAERVGHFYINGKTFTVTQSAAVSRRK